MHCCHEGYKYTCKHICISMPVCEKVDALILSMLSLNGMRPFGVNPIIKLWVWPKADNVISSRAECYNMSLAIRNNILLKQGRVRMPAIAKLLKTNISYSIFWSFFDALRAFPLLLLYYLSLSDFQIPNFLSFLFFFFFFFARPTLMIKVDFKRNGGRRWIEDLRGEALSLSWKPST